MAPHRALFLSDLHIGTGRCCAADLLQLLQSEPTERLILVGDILDLSAWQQKAPHFSSDELTLLKLFWRRQRAGGPQRELLLPIRHRQRRHHQQQQDRQRRRQPPHHLAAG